MFRYSLSWYIFTFTLLESIIKTHLTVHDSSHGFISNNQRYFDNDLSALHEEIASGLRSSNDNTETLKLHLKFEPAFLDFKHRPLGVPHLEKVTLFNINNNKSIDMTSISGSTVHFHSSFFEDKKIPPLGNTSFNVVFLGREEGFVESNLFIHTTDGHFKYNVKGASIYSPYRLRPIVGIKLPINSSFSPFIYMHNPHTEPIQITEMYSSGGDFHLELPSGEQEGPKDIWEIPPLQTKAVIKVRFQAKVEQNHTAYVRIKVNSSDEIFVVPLEVEVTSNGGIYEPQGSIDFGIGGSLDTNKQVSLCLNNPLKKIIKITSVTTNSDAIKIDFIDNVKLLPTVHKSNNNGKMVNGCVEIAKLTLNWGIAHKSKDFSGKIIVKYRNGKSKTEIPYYLTVLEGGLTYDPLTTRYFTNDKSDQLLSRNFKLKNNFLLSVKLINLTLADDAQKFFIIENFKSIIITPGQELNIFTIKLKNGINLSELKLNSYILLKTNISDVKIPLLSYDGKLQMQLPYKSKDYSLDLGLISLESKKIVNFLIINNNPVNLNIKNIKSLIQFTNIDILGCGKKTDYKLALLQVSFKNLTKCTNLKTGDYAVLRLIVQTLHNEGQIWGDIQIETQYENLSLPIQFKIAQGKLEIGPDRLVFDQCFPGKICSHPLRVHSTFNEPMIIDDILSLPPDKRLTSKHTGHILARATKIIGQLYLDPTLECNNECYTGLPSDLNSQWMKTLVLPKTVSDYDLNLVNILYNRYLNLTSNGIKKWQNLTIRLDTTEVRGHLFKTRVKMSWPSILLNDINNENNKSIIIFPLTQLGNITYKNITIRNPSNLNLIVQIIIDKNYPNLKLLLDGIPTNFLPINNLLENKRNIDNNNDNEHGFFFHKNTMEKFYNFIDELNINNNINDNTLPIILKPNENFTFTIGFFSNNTILNKAIIILRNNLTIIELIKLNGQSALPIFKFGNRKPGSIQPLLFELTEKHLKECEINSNNNNNNKNLIKNLTVRRSFTARNTGDITIYINNFYINDLKCEGYGFKIINCLPFVLLPNHTKKIDIAFTPDLTLTKITRTLYLETSLNLSVNYTLYTTIPSYYINLCTNLIQRPIWEIYLSYITILLMLILFIFIIILFILDADKIKKQTIANLLQQSQQQQNHSNTQPILDLRLIGQQIRNEIHSNSNQQQDESLINDEFNNLVDINNDFDEDNKLKIDTNNLKTTSNNDKYSSLVTTTTAVTSNCNASSITTTATSSINRVSCCGGTNNKKKIVKKNSNDISCNNELILNDNSTKKIASDLKNKNNLTTINNSNNNKSNLNEDKKLFNLKFDKKFSQNNNNNKTKITKNIFVSLYDEEASSPMSSIETTTTTSTTPDSSINGNNNDEKNLINNNKICSRKSSNNSQNNDLETSVATSMIITAVTTITATTTTTTAVTTTITAGSENGKYTMSNNHQKIERKKSGPKTIYNSNHNNNKHEGNNKQIYDKNNKINNRSTNLKKDKHLQSQQQQHKKLIVGNSSNNKNLNDIRNSPPIQQQQRCSSQSSNLLASLMAAVTTATSSILVTTSTITASIWGENRATFSDVVSRNDITNTRPISSQIQTTKPTMYVEPYKQTTCTSSNLTTITTTKLGPIGSRRVADYSMTNNTSCTNTSTNTSILSSSIAATTTTATIHNQHHHHHDNNNGYQQLPSNSYFTNTNDIIDSSNQLTFDEFVNNDNWNQQTNFMNLLEYNNENQRIQDPWNQNLMQTTSNSLWNSNYQPLAEQLPIQQIQQQEEQQHQQSVINQQPSYLWGSSSVWQPWVPPELPKTPTRTPPGFDAFHQRKDDEQSQQQQQPTRDVYSPFSTTNIWTQQQSNPWNYQQ